MSTYGVNYISYTRGLSGIRFNSPVSFPRIEMEEINIGDSNSITGYTTGINVGSRNLILSNQSDALYNLINLTGITGTAPGQTPFTGITGQRLVFIGSLAKKRNANFGYENSTDNGGEVYNFGSSNRNFSGLNLVQIGVNSNSSYTNNGAIVGIGNTSSSGNNISILGNSNNVNKFNKINLIGNFNQSNSYAGNIFGNQNNLLNGIEGSVTVLGNANQLKNTNSSNILGDINNISGAGDLYVAGNNNTNISNNDILVLGKNNSILRAQDQIIVGNSITSQDADSSILFGKNITSKNANNISFGASNTIDGNNELVYGKSNSLNFSSNADFILGVNNLLSGTYSNTIIGSDNRSDRFVLDSLYLIGLTGVTGSGQALYTGVTGYIMGGGYGASGVDIVGGNQNFIVGENNLTTLNYGTYTFGNDNRLLDNLNTYVIGANNLSEKSNTSYVFGESNSIGGFKNYIIGNNNIVRTGDYNSVFIGIGYEDILNPKNNSVNIASFDNTIEVSSNDIKLVSSNRPTINNENIVVTSDLNSYLNDSNGLPNRGEVTINNDNTLTDGSYHGYPNQIKIGTFSFDGRETWEPTPFSGYAESYLGGPKAFTNGYFHKINSKYYQTIGGFNTITGNYYYTSNDNAWNMLYTFDLTANGNWIITNVNDDNVYFYHETSRNSGVLPLTDWTTMSELDPLNPWGNQAYGLDPAPTITYLSPETSKNITGEKINPGNWNSSYFNSYGKKAYISDAQGVSIIYGNHSNPKFDPTWLIVDNYSSGLYGINHSSDFFNFPQSGWQSTGFANYTGFNFSSDPFIKISLSKSGVLSSSDPVLGKIYIPFIY
jgi:hypothetical protein